MSSGSGATLPLRSETQRDGSWSAASSAVLPQVGANARRRSASVPDVHSCAPRFHCAGGAVALVRQRKATTLLCAIAAVRRGGGAGRAASGGRRGRPSGGHRLRRWLKKRGRNGVATPTGKWLSSIARYRLWTPQCTPAILADRGLTHFWVHLGRIQVGFTYTLGIIPMLPVLLPPFRHQLKCPSNDRYGCMPDQCCTRLQQASFCHMRCARNMRVGRSSGGPLRALVRTARMICCGGGGSVS